MDRHRIGPEKDKKISQSGEPLDDVGGNHETEAEFPSGSLERGDVYDRHPDDLEQDDPRASRVSARIEKSPDDLD